VRIATALGGARRIVNVGAGTGNYEPADRDLLVAVEPAIAMIEQRPPAAAPAVRAIAESLPFPADSFDAALAVLTVHHWRDAAQGLAELHVARAGVDEDRPAGHVVHCVFDLDVASRLVDDRRELQLRVQALGEVGPEHVIVRAVDRVWVALVADRVDVPERRVHGAAGALRHVLQVLGEVAHRAGARRRGE